MAYLYTLQVGIISQDRYDTIDTLSRSESGNESNGDIIRNLSRSDFGNESNEPSEKAKEMSFSMSVREAAKMKPNDDSIKAIVLTGDDVEQLTVDNWNTILTEYTEIVFSRTTPEQKMLIVEETKKRGDNVVAVVSSSFFSLL